MRFILTLPLLALATLAAADSFTIHPTIPGTTLRDWSSDRPSWRVDRERGTIQPTIPGTTLRDWSQGGYNIERRGGRGCCSRPFRGRRFGIGRSRGS